ITLKYSATNASISYSSFAEEKSYIIKITNLTFKPNDVAITFNRGNSTIDETLTSASYSDKEKTLTFTITSDCNINIKNIHIDNANLNKTVKVNDNYSVSYNTFDIAKTAYRLLIIDVYDISFIGTSNIKILTYKSSTSNEIKSVNGSYVGYIVTFDLEDTGDITLESVNLANTNYKFRNKITLNPNSITKVSFTDLLEDSCYMFKVTGVNREPDSANTKMTYHTSSNNTKRSISGQYDAQDRSCTFKINLKDADFIYVDSIEMKLKDNSNSYFCNFDGEKVLSKDSPNSSVSFSSFDISQTSYTYSVKVKNVPLYENSVMKKMIISAKTKGGKVIGDHIGGTFDNGTHTVEWSVVCKDSDGCIFTLMEIRESDIQAIYPWDITLTPDKRSVTIDFYDLSLYRYINDTKTQELTCPRCNGRGKIQCTDSWHRREHNSTSRCPTCYNAFLSTTAAVENVWYDCPSCKGNGIKTTTSGGPRWEKYNEAVRLEGY
ncbi:hypothetical protein IJT10_00610, partial [bacterium]|nr:hypothetical protein [bacterium]